LQRLLNALGGVNLFKTQLRVRVQIAPQGSQLGVKRGDVGKGAAVGCVFQETVPSDH
jgi:hypothetical protein